MNESSEQKKKEISKRADAGLRALLNMPPKPHKKVGGKKSKSKRKKEERS